MKESFKRFGKVVVTGLIITSPAWADADLTAPTLAMDNVVVIAGALVTGLAALWGIKKAIALLGR